MCVCPVKSINSKGSYEILENETILAKVDYKRYFSSECKTEFNGNKYLIKPKDFWQSKFEIHKNNVHVGNITFTWKGDIVIELNETLIVKRKGFFKHRFEVLNTEKEVLMVLTPNFKLKTWKNDYEVEISNTNLDMNIRLEIVFYACFATNLYQTKEDNMEI